MSECSLKSVTCYMRNVALNTGLMDTDDYVQNARDVETSWIVMAHARKPNFFFRRNERVHLNRWGGRQFSRLPRSRVVRISDSNAGYTMFRGSVKSTGYPMHSPVSPSLPVRHRVPSHLSWSLQSQGTTKSFRNLACCNHRLCPIKGHGYRIFLMAWCL